MGGKIDAAVSEPAKTWAKSAEPLEDDVRNGNGALAPAATLFTPRSVSRVESMICRRDGARETIGELTL